MSNDTQMEAPALAVTGDLTIPRAELVVRATRAGGPGGQHVNTSSTRIELLWNVRTSSALGDQAREWILSRLGKKVDSQGWVRVVAAESRSQLRNRKMAEERLATLIRTAAARPRKRRPTAPSRAAKDARLRHKRLHSEKKERRRTTGDE